MHSTTCNHFTVIGTNNNYRRILMRRNFNKQSFLVSKHFTQWSTPSLLTDSETRVISTPFVSDRWHFTIPAFMTCPTTIFFTLFEKVDVSSWPGQSTNITLHPRKRLSELNFHLLLLKLYLCKCKCILVTCVTDCTLLMS